MDSDITDFLNLEIKRELADRYFSFRKLIEEDSRSLNEDIGSFLLIEQKVAMDLTRIYILLYDPDLIWEFISLSGLEHDFFLDMYVRESPTIQARLFKDVKVRGLTRSGRFSKMLLACYDDLVAHVDDFREHYAQLAKSHALLAEEIDLFYRKNDISSIMGFLRGMNAGPGVGGKLEGAITSGFNESMDEKMRIRPPQPLEKSLTLMPPLVPSGQIKKELKKLAAAALPLHPQNFPQ
ncbi:MAG: hypothetical protein RI601_06250 [Desulfurivibrionaceae bacterium]|nr:hypothetical protein [Desulfurivibrionaceae bacterium]